jgi:hypothetical protein
MPMATKFDQNAYAVQWVRKRRAAWLAQNGPCKQCGSDKDLRVVNIDWANKFAKGVWGWKEDRRLEELKKASVLCQTCFDDKHSEDRRKPINHGSTYAYMNRECRCEVCRKAHAERRRNQPSRIGKKRRLMM